MSLTDQTVRDLVAAFRSAEPTPGGGSAAALAGAVGAALLAMVAALPRPRATSDDEIEQLASAGQRTGQISEELTAFVERDSEAYREVMAAYKLPKTTDEEMRSRSARIQEAVLEATRVPLDVMRRAAAAIHDASTVAAYGNRNASSDVKVALELLGAGLRGARLNVEINLGSLKDAGQVGEIRSEVARLSGEAEERIAAAIGRLNGSSA
jgi:formiminotetrahydrofolate cyclodeaminase